MSTLVALRALRDALAGDPEHAAGVAAIDHVLGVILEKREAKEAFDAAMLAYCEADPGEFHIDSSSLLSSAFCSPETRARVEPLKRAYKEASARLIAAERALVELLKGDL